ANINKELFDYYKGLIELRKTYKAFRRANYDDITFIELKSNPFALGYSVKFKDEEFVVLLNADTKSAIDFELPDGQWEIIVDENTAGIIPIKVVQKGITVSNSSGIVLKKK
ncbi:MAG: pullulanase, partial [Ignavibacteriaceae bacterium]|nr:pullulanase [Ignavibacteriaceae bacterium]